MVMEDRKINPGDTVYVIDPYFDHVSNIMARSGLSYPLPSRIGVVQEMWHDNQTVLIHFNDDWAGIYPVSQVRHQGVDHRG
jgi:hypothetical protein